MILKHAPRKVGTRDRLAGLLAYLAGPGRGEEHTNQRIVAAWDGAVTEVEIRDPAEQMTVAEQMEWPAQAWDMEVPKAGFVYHAPISLHTEDGQLSDEQWAYVARKAIAKLGFDGCRWVAVHHGLADPEENPRDHLHLVIHRAREDGTVASTWNDYRKLAELRAELEDDPTLGLRVKTQRQGGGRAGWKQGERRRAEREDRRAEREDRRAGREEQPETDRDQLERLVRAGLGPAESEADWVTAMRRSGVLVRPRYAQGGMSQVVGYSVALAPMAGQQPVWYGGGKLAQDLTLSAIRNRWDGHDPAEALATWAAASQQDTPQERTPTPRRGRQERDAGGVSAQRQHASEALAAFEQHMLATPTSDTVTWRVYARETAEILSTLSTSAPAGDRRVLARSARQLSRTAETGHGQPRGQSSNAGSTARAVCQILTSGALAGQGGLAAVAQLTGQLRQLSDAVSRAHQARHDAAAARLAAETATELYTLHQALHGRAEQRPTGAGPAHPAALAAMASPQHTRSGNRGSSGRPAPGSVPPHRRRGQDGPERGTGR